VNHAPTLRARPRPTDLYTLGELAALTGLSRGHVRKTLWHAGVAHHRFVGERAYSLSESLPWLAMAKTEIAGATPP
jgi:hypothetical protein